MDFRGKTVGPQKCVLMSYLFTPVSKNIVSLDSVLRAGVVLCHGLSPTPFSVLIT